jgi:hypothetical protein
MNRRTILLLAAAGLVGLLYALDSGYRSWIEEPTQRLEGKITSLQQELSDANAEQVAGRRLANQLDDYASRALPHDPELARSRYQAWLLHLVDQHGLQSASVDADAPQQVEIRGRIDRKRRRSLGYTIRYTLRARTTLPQLTDFLHDFQRSGQLHKIRSFALNPQGLGDQLNLDLSIETLSLEATERAEELSSLVRADTSFPSRQAFTTFVQRNIFAKGFSRTLGQIRLTAITRNRQGQLEAWFAVGSPAKTQILTDGGKLELDLHEVRVQSIESTRVEVTVNGITAWITLGNSIGEILQPETVPADIIPADTSPSDITSSEPEPASESSAITLNGN